MSNDQERLLVALEARITDFERKMRQASNRGTHTFTGLSKASRTATKNMEDDMVRSTTRINQALATTSAKIGSFGKAAIGGLIGGIAAGGIAGIVDNFRELARGVAEVGDQARIAGVSSKAFQELRFAADQVRIPVDALQDGLKELSLRTDEFIASSGKSGSAAESFHRLGYSVSELKQKIKEPSELLVELVGRVQKLDKAAQTRIFDELFGGQGGEEFVKFLTDGEAGLRANIKAANDFGIIIDDQMIKKAAEVDRRFNMIATTVSTNLKTAIISAADSMDGFITQYERWRSAVDAGNAGAAMGSLIGTKMPQGPNQPAVNTATPTTGRLPSATDIMRGKLLQQRLDQAFEDQSSTYKPAAAKTSRPNDLQRNIQQLREHIEAMKADTAAQEKLNPLIDDYGFAAAKAAAKQDLLTAATRAGKDITPELASEIEKLSDAYGNATVASQQLAEKQDKVRENAENMVALQRDITSTFIDALTSSTSFADAALSSLKKIGDYLINDFLDSVFTVKNAASGGGFFGFLGSLFGGSGGGGSAAPSWLNNGFDTGLPKFAKGGVSDTPSIFAEAGPEAAVPLPDGRRIPVDLGNSNAGTMVNATYAPVLHFTGTSDELTAIRREMARDRAEFASKTIRTIKEHKRRGNID